MRAVWTIMGLLAMTGAVVAQDKPETKPAEKKAIELEYRLTDKAGSGDKKLEELEAKLQALLKEIQALRAAKPATEAPAKPTATVKFGERKPVELKLKAGEVKPAKTIELKVEKEAKPMKEIELRFEKVQTKPVQPAPAKPAAPGTPATGKTVLRNVIDDGKMIEKGAVIGNLDVPHTFKVYGKTDSGENVVTLTRATYQLPAASAKALNDFLTGQVKARVLEVKVEGDKITITTTPEAQQIIGALVALMQGKTSATSSDRFRLNVLQERLDQPARFYYELKKPDPAAPKTEKKPEASKSDK